MKSPSEVTSGDGSVIRRLTFVVPVRTTLSEEGVRHLLDKDGMKVVRILESIVLAYTSLRATRFEHGPSVKPYVGKEKDSDL